MLTPNAKRAIARRVFLVGGTLLAITFALWQRSQLYRVEVVDFASKQQEEPGWTGRRQKSLLDYIGDKTQGRLLRKVEPAWLDLYADVAAARQYRFFLPDQTPLNELAGAFDGEFTYVAVQCDGQVCYLGVDVSRSGDFPAVPARLRYPLRWLAPGPTLLVASRTDRVIELVLRDGRRRRFGLMGARHLDRLISSLGQAGIPVDPDLASPSSR